MNMYAKRKPYRTGYFPVGNGHELYYALYGNPNGVPVLFVHGGPGGGCGDRAHRHFNPKKFNIIIVDQRGAGNSRPFASLKANNTQNLVKDFKKILNFLKIKKTLLFGGSWGSCLSLCFAIKYPKMVLGMVLRGIYLGGSFETDYMLSGTPQAQFPEVWERFMSFVPKGRKPLPYYLKMMNSKNNSVARKFCKEWTRYESSLCSLYYDPKKVDRELKGNWVVAIARIEALYFKNNCFLPNNYILRNINKIKNIPLSMVHGRYDFVCEPKSAYILHKALPKSKLFFVFAGHSSADPEIRKAMMREIAKMGAKQSF